MLVEVVPLLLLPFRPAVFVDEIVLGEGDEPGREILLEIIFGQGLMELYENVLGQILGLLEAAGELIRHVEDLLREEIDEHIPGSFFAVQAIANDGFQIHSLHPDRRVSKAESSLKNEHKILRPKH
jgi:hypothetical protein